MLFSKKVLRDLIDLADLSDKQLRVLFDEIGLEVKAMTPVRGDTVFNIELLANRGDHASHVGIATEVGARLGRPVRALEVGLLPSQRTSVEVHCPSPLCSRYVLMEFDANGGSSPLSPSQEDTLRALGFGVQGTWADLSSWVLLEMGHPTHFLDADKVAGALTIKEADAEFPFVGVDGATYQVPAGATLISDAAGTVHAVAGVLGASASAITADTRRVLVECAVYDPVSVRTTARKMKVQTRASFRFERGADFDGVVLAAGRVLSLAGRPARFAEYRCDRQPPRVIALRPNFISDFLGTHVSTDQSEVALRRLGFEVHGDGERGLEVTVPTTRWWDIRNEFDVAEEVARLAGYNALGSSIPRLVGKIARRTPLYDLSCRVRDQLVALGFDEVLTTSLHGPSAMLPGASPESAGSGERHVRTMNSIESSLSTLRKSCFDTMLPVLTANANRGMASQRLFEVGNVFWHEADGGSIREDTVVAGLMVGRVARHWRSKDRMDFHHLRGAVEQLLAALDVAAAIAWADLARPYRGKHGFEVRSNGALLGNLGEVRSEYAPDVQGSVLFFELSLSALLQQRRPALSLVEPSAYPSSSRDLTLVVPVAEPLVDEVTARLLNIPSCVAVNVVDAYSMEGGDPQKITWRAIFQRGDRSLVREEVDELFESAVADILVHCKLQRG